ncbi:30S ribosomal protein S6 [Carboxydothermus islandicus]|uniref:Small ribosomal subunit protein bS6 n=1 Tax=Carboxydothermus islandicus TaxID=661089 RepID=A0A1L8D1V2_9THEO|nr:30S ribosomal protein S6 [Carboxydothermus islandicus]GAV25160.1 30S ribosomal protein S6 [Carboxydothermus islandicus]
MLRQYEVMYILHPELDAEKTESIIERFKGMIEQDGGEVTNIDRWGKRRFAYEIKKLREGYYVVMNFKAKAETVQELDRVLRISDDVVRHIVIREDK